MVDPLFIDTGRLRCQVTILQRAEADTTAGLPSDTWTAFGVAPAYFDHIAQQESFQAPQMSHQATHKVTLRYLPGVTDQMRLSYAGALYEIQFVDNVQMRDIKLQLFTTLRS